MLRFCQLKFPWCLKTKAKLKLLAGVFYVEVNSCNTNTEYSTGANAKLIRT